jgi:hypothetical protein
MSFGFLSMRHQQFTFVRLSDPYLTVLDRLLTASFTTSLLPAQPQAAV